MSRRFLPFQAPGHDAIAPSAMLRLGSGTIDSSVGTCCTPRPWHTGHMPVGVFGEKASESSRPRGPSSIPWGYSPAREYSSRIVFDSAVMVATEDRAVPPPRCWPMATVGGRPSTDRTWGSTAPAISRRANGATDSR